MYRVSVALAVALCGLAGAGETVWQRRALRARAPRGYIAVVTLAAAGAEASAAVVCEREGVELRAARGQWQVLAGGRTAGQGALAGDGPRRLLVKRAAAALMVGVDDRWVYGQDVAPTAAAPSVRVGTAGGCRVETFRLVAREPVRFADDFPDPEPGTELWRPLRGRWLLSSLSSPEQSANPAELAAAFEAIDDVGSRGRTRERYVGVGVRLGGGRAPQIMRLAGDAPAARAGLKQGDVIKAVDGVEARSADHAMGLLTGQLGDRKRVTAVQRGVERVVELPLEIVVWGKTRRNVPIPPASDDDQALIAAGYDFWTDYRLACAVQTRTVGAFGLAFACLGPADYHLFRWLSGDRAGDGVGCWQLVRVRGGLETVLAERAGGYFANDLYAMSVAIEGDRPGAVRAVGAVDGRTVVEASDDAIVPGRLGLWAGAPGYVCFDDVVAGEPQRPAARGSANRVQRRDPVMRAWADPAYAWQYAGVGQRWWHKADFHGDVDVIAHPVDGLAAELAIAAVRRDELSGYIFHLSQDRTHTTLRRGERKVAEKPVAGPAPKAVTLRRQGPRVEVELDGKPWMAFRDPEPLGGWAVRVRGVLVRDVALACANAVEYYFNRAPTEWHVMAGHWEVMNRWVCDPRWSFFGGRSEGVLAVWSKRRLEGTCSLDAWVGVMMFERSGSYENMRDVGLTLCGDGRNLASGYAVIAGAEANRKTALFRNGRCVLTTRDPAALLAGRSSSRDQLRSKHRGWMHLKLARERDRVRFYVWGRLVLDYRDPEPLGDGHAALWSLDNGLFVGKARLAADRLGRPELFVRPWCTFADAALTNDCPGGHVRILRQGSTHAVTNALGGGPFAVALRPRLFSALERPVLECDIKLSPQAKVDLYLTCHGQLYRVVIAGPPDGWTPAQTLGAVEGVAADRQWHKLRFDLRAALRARHPDDPLLMVWDPRLANHANDGYLLAGFGGNAAGTTYWLRNLRLAPADDATRLSQRPARPPAAARRP